MKPQVKKEYYLRAIAGLLHSPDFVSSIAEIVPDQWASEAKGLLADPIINIASKLAAGLDRVERVPSKSGGNLVSIFCTIKADGAKSPERRYILPAELRIDKNVLFPVTREKLGDKLTEHWTLFLKEAGSLKTAYKGAEDSSLPFFTENLLLLFQRFLWSIPCGIQSLSDVSLYDHNRITAALSALEARDMLLVGGDISGLQDFIYTISADGAASALRGRSFYLQLLNEILPRMILRSLDLPVTNLIYAGGGNFYMLIRSTDKNKLDELQDRISRTLLVHHRGDLALALASLSLSESDFLSGGISKCWNELGGELQIAKQKRFAELGDSLKRLFTPHGDGGKDDKQCRVCGLEHSKTKNRDSESKPRICPPCEQFEGLGRDLRKAQYLAVKQIKEDSTPSMDAEPGTWRQILNTLGYDVVIHQEETQPDVSGPATLFALKDDGVRKLSPHADLAVGRRYFVNVTPIVQPSDREELKEKQLEEELKLDTVKPFDALQEQSKGLKRLGVLRMDVDNLGRLFAEGLEAPCLARIASLSFAISLYFEGWVEHLAEERNRKDGKDRLYSIYSGGDDLFFVGSWDAIVELAREIRKDLTNYTADHPGIHASAGIALIGGKYPLYQAARDAGEAEERAKVYVSADGKSKNAITFLGETIAWDLFGMDECGKLGADDVHALMHQLDDMLQTKGNQPAPPRALLGILMDLQEKFSTEAHKRQLEGTDKNKSGGKQLLFGPWQWLGFYQLKRMIRREQNRNADFAKKIEQLTEQLQKKQFGNIEWIGLSARWAELIGRKSK